MTTYVCASQAEMLALSAGVGDLCARIDLAQFLELQALPPSTASNWQIVFTCVTDAIPLQAFGGSPTASPDINTAALMNAAASGENKIVMGPGTWQFGAGTTVVDHDGFTLQGSGIGVTIVEMMDSTSGFLQFGAGSTSRVGLTLSDIWFQAGTSKTAGYVLVLDNTINVNVQRCREDGFFGILSQINGNLTSLVDVHGTLATPNTGKFISVTGGGSNLMLTRVATDGGPGTQPLVGLYVEEFDGIFIANSQFNRSGNGAVVASPSGAIAQNIFCVNSSFDTNALNGFEIMNNGGLAQRLWFSNTWFGTSTNNGFMVDAGAQVTGLRFTGCESVLTRTEF
ncbi:MAG: hypothetical protein ACYCY8_08565 [Burkholderiales bacterium]